MAERLPARSNFHGVTAETSLDAQTSWPGRPSMTATRRPSSAAGSGPNKGWVPTTGPA